ncbi:hypothetical protein GCM10023149_21250 [Mucilaginibacter gynuensis]|uniref:Core-binding (CB) domain-containing protein n=1 Tax=Mucilaginibacter gynuensis TaxID=1302236 RepID=A0ABP8GCA8_9SPHI
MALASYGKPEFIKDFREMVQVSDNGRYAINDQRFEERFGPKRLRHEDFTSLHFNIAHSLQLVIEESLLELTGWLEQETTETRLCLAGVVALNCVANARSKRKEHPVYIRITVNGSREEWSTGRKCYPLEWDRAAKRVKGTREYARSINNWLDVLQARAYACRQELYASGKTFTAVHIRKLMQGEELEPPKMLSDVWDYHTNQIAGLLGKGYTAATLQKYKSVFRVLRKFLLLKTQKDDIKLDDIDYQLVRDFDHYLKADYGVKINTAVQMVKKLRTMMKIANEIGWAKHDPFVAYRQKRRKFSVSF